MILSLRVANILLCLSVFSLVACASVDHKKREEIGVKSITSIAELQHILDADQADRQSGAQIDWAVVGQRDRVRLDAVKELLATGKLKTATDFYNAALVCQHGSSVDDIRIAHALATISRTIDPKDINAAWLFAASWDRIMMQLEKPQWYGTQFTKSDTPGSKWELYKLDETAVTDDDRRKLGVPSLQEARERTNKMNEPQT
jgi:hypothetical protein